MILPVGKKTLLIDPYGGELKELLIPTEERAELTSYANSLRSIQLSARSLCDLEMLATGAFSPLDRFMGEADYRSVLEKMRLATGEVFPIPITLPVAMEIGVREGSELALRDGKKDLVAIMKVEETYKWDKAEFGTAVLNTHDGVHPLVAEMNGWGDINISGRLRVINLPRYYDFPKLRLTPKDVRGKLEELGNPDVVAFQTRNPLHRAHEELTKQAMKTAGAVLLLHPVVGLTRPGDVSHYCRVRTYKTLVDNYYEQGSVLLALLPLAMRMAGPREALWHAMIRRNYGANHLIVGRDHAGAGIDSAGRPFYGPEEARNLCESFSEELGVAIIPFREFAYVPELDRYEEVSQVPSEKEYVTISGTAVREEYLNKGRRLPDWFTRPEVARILEESHPPRSQQGFCLWFTGLSGAGKSTTAEVVASMIQACGRSVTLLDGDVVRANLSAGLGFDKAGRDANIRRIGFVASEIVKHGGVALCAAISPYQNTRDEVRSLFSPGRFFEIFVDTPLEVCEMRDTKGMYARARRGEIKEFTGIDDVYEQPSNPEVRLQTTEESVESNSAVIIDLLTYNGFLR